MAGTLPAPLCAPGDPLPARRHAEVRSLTHRAADGRACTLTLAVEYHPTEPARPRAIAYLAGLRSGAELERDLRDLCVLLSTMLHAGLDPAVIGRALAEEEACDDAGGRSRAAAILDELSRPPSLGGADLTGNGPWDAASPTAARWSTASSRCG